MARAARMSMGPLTLASGIQASIPGCPYSSKQLSPFVASYDSEMHKHIKLNLCSDTPSYVSSDRICMTAIMETTSKGKRAVSRESILRTPATRIQPNQSVTKFAFQSPEVISRQGDTVDFRIIGIHLQETLLLQPLQMHI